MGQTVYKLMNLTRIILKLYTHTAFKIDSDSKCWK